MREKLNHLYVDNRERAILLQSLVELKNQLIQQGRNVLIDWISGIIEACSDSFIPHDWRVCAENTIFSGCVVDFFHQ